MSETQQRPAPQQPQGQPSPLDEYMAAIADSMAQMAQAMQMQAQAMQMAQQSMARAAEAMGTVAQAQMAPRRIIMDDMGNPVGAEPML